jgi:hypothetical protein
MRDVNMICVSLLNVRLKVSHIYAPEGYFSGSIEDKIVSVNKPFMSKTNEFSDVWMLIFITF